MSAALLPEAVAIFGVVPRVSAASTRSTTAARGRGRGLTQEMVIAAARRLAEGGPEALTMGALAEALGVTPMAAYRHVANKDELIALVLEDVVSEVEVPAADSGPWQERLRLFHRRINLALNKYPGLLFKGHSSFKRGIEQLETYLTILIEAGFDEETAAKAYTGLYYLAIGTVSNAVHYPDSPSPAARTLSAEAPLPVTARVAPIAAQIDTADYHDFALDAYIAGLEALLAAGRPKRRWPTR